MLPFHPKSKFLAVAIGLPPECRKKGGQGSKTLKLLNYKHYKNETNPRT